MSSQRADRLESAEKIIYSLQVAIQARAREISRLTGRLAESLAQQVPIYRDATAYYRELQEAIITMCNGGDNALRAARGLFDDQSRVIVSLRNRLRHHLVSWPLGFSITTADITGIDAPGLNPSELYFKLSLVSSCRSAFSRRHITRIDGGFTNVISSDRLDLLVVE